jgi:hypothetical protein
MDAYIEQQIEDVLFDYDEKLARKRVKWPNPNMDDEMEALWKAYKIAYARAIWNPCAPTETGASAWEDLRQKWILFKEAVVNERPF